MSWLAILLLAAATFGAVVMAMRVERVLWPALAASLLFGLAGYAVQGQPQLPGAPKKAQAIERGETGEAIVSARRELFGDSSARASYLTVSDGFARRGRFADAAKLLRKGLADNPDDVESWVALGNALVEHAGGQLTPAALYAYEKAQILAPDHPAPAYFLGVALIRSGRPQDARALWQETLEKARADAPWREGLQSRLDQLDAMMAAMPSQMAP